MAYNWPRVADHVRRRERYMHPDHRVTMCLTSLNVTSSDLVSSPIKKSQKANASVVKSASVRADEYTLQPPTACFLRLTGMTYNPLRAPSTRDQTTDVLPG